MKIESLSSPAKMKIFKLLVRVKSPLCFREIVSLANVGIRSAQIALGDFKRLKIVKAKQQKNKIIYEVIDSKLAIELKSIFEVEARNKISENANTYTKEVHKTIATLQGLYNLSKKIDLIKAKL